MVKIAAFSDTHGQHHDISLRAIPPVDIAICAGDFEGYNYYTTADFLRWFSEMTAEHKVLIAGNHDFYPEDHSLNGTILEFAHACREYGITYLEESGIECAGLKIWGSPYTPPFNDWAYMSDDRDWSVLPPAVDILVTHGPPPGGLDVTQKGRH